MMEDRLLQASNRLHSANFTAHEMAFLERSSSIRREHLATLLQSAPYEQSIFERCQMYVEQTRHEYVAHRNLVHHEEAFDNNWGLLTWEQKTYLALTEPFHTTFGRIVVFFQALMLTTAIAALILETEPMFNPVIHPDNESLFIGFEFVFTAYFSIETLLTFYVCPDRKKHARTLGFWLDVAGCLPLFVTYGMSTMVDGMNGQLDAVRMLRLLRAVRLLQVIRPVKVLISSLTASIYGLAGPLGFLIVWILLTATLMYFLQGGTYDESRQDFVITDCTCEASPHHFANHTQCPDEQSPFSIGIPRSLWWSTVTTMTVGYGDVVPTCALGQLIAICCMIMSTLVMAMPIAVMGSNFTEEVLKERMYGERERLDHSQELNNFIQRALQVVVARRLHEVREEKLMKLCHRLSLPVISTTQMCDDVYSYFNLNPESSQEQTLELPVIMALGESLFDYLRRRIPVEVINLNEPAPEIVDLISTFFERIYIWHLNEDVEFFNYRLEAANPSTVPSIVPLVKPTMYSIGVHVDGIPDPDFVIPVSEDSEDGVASLGARLGTIYVDRHFGVTRFILKPNHPFIPLLQGTPIPPEGILLHDRDLINFGTDTNPVIFSFHKLDEFSRASHVLPTIDPEVAARYWLTSRDQEEQTILRRRSPPQTGVNIFEAPSPSPVRMANPMMAFETPRDRGAYEAVTSQDIQFVI